MKIRGANTCVLTVYASDTLPSCHTRSKFFESCEEFKGNHIVTGVGKERAGTKEPEAEPGG
jgi:hypothetical protein